MREFIGLLEFLRRFKLQSGEVRVTSLLDDERILQARLKCTSDSSILWIDHSEIGSVQFTPLKTSWTRAEGSIHVEDAQADNRALLSVLTSGLAPQISWLTDALQLAEVNRPELESPLDRLRNLRNGFTAFVLPGMSWFNARFPVLHLPGIVLQDFQGHVSLRNLALDPSDYSVGMELSILGGRGAQAHLYTGEEPGSGNASLTSIELADVSFHVDAEIAVSLIAGAQDAFAADMHLRSSSFRAAAGTAELFPTTEAASSPNPDPLSAQLGRVALTINNLVARVEQRQGQRTSTFDGGPIRIWSESASARKNSLELNATDSVNSLVAQIDSVTTELFVDAKTDSRQPIMSLRGRFSGVVDLRCDFQSPAMQIRRLSGSVSIRNGAIQGASWQASLETLVIGCRELLIQTGGDLVRQEMRFSNLSLASSLKVVSGETPTLIASFIDLAAENATFKLYHEDINPHLRCSGNTRALVSSDATMPFSQLTVSGRVFVHDFPLNGLAVLVAHQLADAKGFLLALRPDGRIVLRLHLQSGIAEFVSNQPLPIRIPVNVWVRYDGAHVRIFFEDHLVGEFPATGAIDLLSQHAVFEIGATSAQNYEGFRGLLGDAMIWRMAHDPPYGLETHRDGLYLHAPLDGALYDASPNGNSVEANEVSFDTLPFTLSAPNGVVVRAADLRNGILTEPSSILAEQFSFETALLESTRLYSIRSKEIALRDCMAIHNRARFSGWVGRLSGQGASAFHGTLNIASSDLSFQQLTVSDYSDFGGVNAIHEIGPISPNDTYQIKKTALAFDDGASEIGVIGVSQKFRSAEIALGSGTTLVVEESQENRLRVNSLPHGAGQDGLAAQLRLDSGFVAPSDPRVEFSNVQFDAYSRTIADDLDDDLRTIKSRALMRFSTQVEIDPFTIPAPPPQFVGFSLNHLADILIALNNFLQSQLDVDVLKNWLGDAFELLDKALNIFDEVTDIKLGFYLKVFPTDVAIAGNLPNPITPNAPNQMMFRISGGTDKIRAALKYRYPKLVIQGINSRIEWRDGEEVSPWVSIFFKMDIYVRISFSFDNTTRRVLFSDVEFWLLQQHGGNVWTASIETILKVFIDLAFNVSGIKSQILKQVNSRLSQETSFSLPAEWDLDVVRIQTSPNGVSIATQATVTEWQDL